MELTAPLMISARLMPAVEIGQGDERATISLELVGRDGDDRLMTRLFIDRAGVELFEGEGPRSGCGAFATEGEAARGLIGAALSFLASDAESYRYSAAMGTREPSEPYLFGAEVAEWAYQMSSEIDMLAFEMTEGTSWEDGR